MNRAECWLVIVLSLIPLSATARSAERADTRPNIVIFLADDLSWSDCSVYGDSGIHTPRMKQLADRGMLFTHAFVASPSCAPSRGALLTGLNPAQNGAMFNHTVPDPKHKRWPAYFRDLGYEVAAIGKVAHYATVRQYGFDHVSHFNYHQDDCVTAAVDWLEARETAASAKAKKPLCLFVGTNWPHVPWPEQTEYETKDLPLPPTQIDTEETRQWRTRYAAAVTNADRDLGIVYDAATRLLGENTLFIFTSDHGSQFPFGKWNCYDAGIRTPLIAVWPGHIAAGSQSDALVSWIDLLPTCMDAAGGKPPAVSGKSFLKVLRGEAKDHRELIFTTHSGDGKMNQYPIRSVRSRGWKYIRNLAPDSEHHTHVDRAKDVDGSGYWQSWARAAMTDPKAASVVERYHRRPPEELYDLAADPWELRNLATDPAHHSRLTELRSQLDAWMKEQSDDGMDLTRIPKP